MPPDLTVSFDRDIYADFNLCPFSRSRPGVMQRVCVESAKRRIVRERSGSKWRRSTLDRASACSRCQVKGYFEVAHRGIIFFDEIGTIGADTQAKLLPRPSFVYFN